LDQSNFHFTPWRGPKQVLPVSNQTPLPVRKRFFYGWAIVGISALGIFFSGPGQTYSISAFVDPLINHFGWSRSLVSSLYSLGTLCAGVAMTGMGRLVDVHGHRTMMPIVAATFGLACLFMSAVLNPFMLLIGFGLIRFLGQGSMTLVSNTLVPQWFRFKRGRAMSLIALGGAISTASLPKINTWLIEVVGWRSAWQVWAVILILAIAPLFRLLVRNRPEDIGLLPDNMEVPAPGTQEAVAEEESWTLAEAMRTRTFWLLITCMGIPAMINTGLIFHQVSILGARGLSPSVSATVFSVAVLVHLPVNFLAGYLLERIPPRMALAGIFTGHLILMTWILWTNSIGMAIGMGVLRGIIGGFEGVTSGVLWPTYFGRRHIGSIGGAAMTVMVVGSAMGPLPFGLAFDIFGGYSQIIWIMMAFPVFGIVGALLAVPPRKPV